MDTQKERDIIEAVLAGDSRAYAHLVDSYKGQVFNLIYRMTGNRNDAEDLAQETFLRAYNKLWRYDPSRPFFAWLYTIALNITRNHIKRTSRSDMGKVEWLDNVGRNGEEAKPVYQEEAVLKEEEQKMLQDCLLLLPEYMREAVILRYIDERPFEEVAMILGVSLSTAKMRVYRALERLKQLLE